MSENENWKPKPYQNEQYFFQYFSYIFRILDFGWRIQLRLSSIQSVELVSRFNSLIHLLNDLLIIMINDSTNDSSVYEDGEGHDASSLSELLQVHDNLPTSQKFYFNTWKFQFCAEILKNLIVFLLKWIFRFKHHFYKWVVWFHEMAIFWKCRFRVRWKFFTCWHHMVLWHEVLDRDPLQLW